MNVLVWLKRDLRVTDHPALCQAAEMGKVLPLYIVEPALWAAPAASGRQWEFISECLLELREDLARLGAPLVVRMGDAVTVLERMRRQHEITHMLSHQDLAPAAPCSSHTAVTLWAQERAVIWQEIPSPRATQTPLEAPRGLRAFSGLEPGAIPHARALKLKEDRCPHRQIGGRSRAEAQLHAFLTKRAAGYLSANRVAAVAERSSSRLSPFLAQGVLSLAEVGARAAQLQAEPSYAWPNALQRFRYNLTLRRPHVGESLPAPALAPASSKGLGLFAEIAAPEAKAAWLAGETGLPFLDAAMRYLSKTGWLNAPMRAMVASVALHQLQLSPQTVGTELARLCTDYDPDLHWANLHKLCESGRAINPVKLGEKLDPDGQFTRRWLPELASLSDAELHSPWRSIHAANVLGARYPEPIVNPVPPPRPTPTPRANHAPLPLSDLIEARIPQPRRPAPEGQLTLGL